MRPFKIIIVENDEDERFFMQEAFNNSDKFELIECFPNGNELIAWLSAQGKPGIDVVLTDLNMPGKNGYDIIEYIRSRPELLKLPVIVTSTSSTSISVDRSLKAGATDYLVKPEIFIDYGPFVEQLSEKLTTLLPEI